MALTSVATNSVVDLSEENDNSANHAPGSSNTTASFERSCDNPECSAPRLISMVQKPIASEFVTEPMVVHKPTLINGFTTVFQIDGIGTRMEDIMNESTANNNIGGNHKPKTVFRVVPNTHAHIVNYVVVEAAAETMQKIKANDPETMCKLLISQRLSAEQMLKKLIGKALEVPSRVDTASNAPSQIAVPPPILAPAPVEIAKPQVPPNITKKLPTVADANKTSNTSTDKRIPKKPTTEHNKSVTTAKGLSSSTNRIAVKPPSQLNKPRKPVPIAPKKPITNSSQPSAVAETSPRPTTLTPRVIPASKPVVWQAIPPSPKTTSTPNMPPPAVPAKSTPPVVITTSNLNTSPPQQDHELFDVEKAITSTAITVHRSPVGSNIQENTLKRKLDATQALEVVKRLRPRSPVRMQNLTPLADDSNVSIVKFSTPLHKKLPTLPKPPKQTAPPMKIPPSLHKPAVGRNLVSQKNKVKPIEEKQVKPLPTLSNSIENEVSVEPSPPTELDTSVRRKNKPLMGPASKMKALKAIAEAKTKALEKDPLLTCQKTAITTESGQMKIGETTITRTGSSKGIAKESPKPAITLTKPCSVAITDIAKTGTATDSDNDSLKSNKRLRQNVRPSAEKEAPNTKNKNGGDESEDKFKGRFTMKKEDDKLSRKPFLRATRSMASPKSTNRTPHKSDAPDEDISDSTLLTTPSAPSRVLRVVLPSTKNGIVNNPSTAPHPNLKISSVISGGGTTLAAPMMEVDRETSPLSIDDDSNGPGIEQLQKELADLRRTVARLTQGRKT
ncbi:mucin-2 [Eupeodes corollae]|uniref:mucin-2 n=1 Tax=Eupeodes corollae TaxID=290404 RepID=UPI002493C2FD|nr:mucin-2 [Eupeodes corollae]